MTTRIITLENFSGPLDLLLHVIKESELDIMEVSLVSVVNQYIHIIEMHAAQGFDVGTEYLDMAADLIRIKARKLLPFTEDEEESVYEDALHEEILLRLLEYKKYNDVVPYVKDAMEDRSAFYTRPSQDVSHLQERVHTIPLDKLIDAMTGVLQRLEYHKPLSQTIVDREISLDDMRKHIRERFERDEKPEFSSIFSGTRIEIVYTFLAVLEMIRKFEIEVIEEEQILYLKKGESYEKDESIENY